MASPVFAELDPQLSQLARVLYDPGGHVTEEYQQQFGSFVLGLYGTGRMNRIDTAVALSCDYLEYGYDRATILAQVETFGAADQASVALDKVQRRAERHAGRIVSEVRRNNSGSNLLLASADLLARESYAGKYRRSGRPYYYHPMEAAALGLEAFTALHEQGGFEIDQSRVDASVASFLLHDGAEETNRSCKFFRQRAQSFSPLLVRMIFDKFENPYGQQVADALRLMTHLDRKKMPWAPGYLEYIGACMSKFQYCISKPSDIVHNLVVEPKIPRSPQDYIDAEKIASKRVEYFHALQKLGVAIISASYSADATPNDARWAPHYVEKVSRAGLLGNMSSMIGNLSLRIYGDQDHISAATAA